MRTRCRCTPPSWPRDQRRADSADEDAGLAHALGGGRALPEPATAAERAADVLEDGVDLRPEVAAARDRAQPLEEARVRLGDLAEGPALVATVGQHRAEWATDRRAGVIRAGWAGDRRAGHDRRLAPFAAAGAGLVVRG